MPSFSKREIKLLSLYLLGACFLTSINSKSKTCISSPSFILSSSS
ncbi:hypothetical protein X908_07975 (plasmid) [Campylobacter jejuni subsp. jejuni 81-176-DRH212]|nr:hypothetical protein X908_07975 [Campylobacter jejuni subsp. jejuni 81-176-DRH212]